MKERKGKLKTLIIIILALSLLLGGLVLVKNLIDNNKSFDIVVLESAHGSVSVDKTKAHEGETITITATPDEGYEVHEVLVNGKISDLVFKMPKENITILVKFSLIADDSPNEIIGETFGGVDGYKSSDGVDLSHDNGENPYVIISGGGNQFAYLNEVFNKQIYFETYVKVNEIFNKDKYPKFGLILDGEKESVLFYVDMKTDKTASKVGVVHQAKGKDYDWANAYETNVAGMKFTGDDAVKLSIARNNNNFYFYVNDKLVLMDKDVQTGNMACGVFSFNTGLKLDRYEKAVDDATKAKTSKAVNDGLYLRGDFFGWYKKYRSSKEVKMIYDHGNNPKLVMDGKSPQYAYINDVFTDKFSFTTTISVNDILNNDKAPKFGIMINNEKRMVKFYVDMNDSKQASLIGAVWQKTNGQDEWSKAITERMLNHDFAYNGNIQLKVVRDKDNFYFFVDDVLLLANKGLTNDQAAVGVFSFNTNMTLSNYSIKVGEEANGDIDYAIDQTKRLKGDFFGSTKDYKTSIAGVDLYYDRGSNPYITFYGPTPQYAYVNNTFSKKLVFETEISVSKIINNDQSPKFGLMINGASAMYKFYVDMNPDLSANTVGMVKQGSDGDDEWNNVATNQVANMSFAGNDTVKLKLVRNNKDYYFYVDDKLVLFEKDALSDESTAVGIFSFNSEIKAKNYSIKKDSKANSAINAAKTEANAIGDFILTTNYFTDNNDGTYTLISNDQSLHKIDDIKMNYHSFDKPNKEVSLKIELSDADPWGQARVLVSKDANNEMFVALEKKDNGKYQVFTMSKNNESDFDHWKLIIPEQDENYLDLDVLTIGNDVYFINNNSIIYEKHDLDLNNSQVKVTGYNNANVAVSNIEGQIFADAFAAQAYLDNLKITVNYYEGNILIDSEQLNNNDTITKIDPVKDNYKFVAWYKDEALTVLFDKAEKISGSLNLYAKFNKIETIQGIDIEIGIKNELDGGVMVANNENSVLYDTTDIILNALLQGNISPKVDITADQTNQIKAAKDNNQDLYIEFKVEANVANLNASEENIIQLFDSNANIIATYEINILMTIKIDNTIVVDEAKVNELSDDINIVLPYPATYDNQDLNAVYIHNGTAKQTSVSNINKTSHTLTVKSKEFSKYVITANPSGFSLSTNYFTKSGSSYSLTSDSNDESKVDDVMHLGEVLRGKYYRVNGTLDLDTDTNWTQSRIIISNDPSNEYFIALEKVGDNLYQIFTMSKDNEASWNDWREIEHYELNGNRHSIDFEIIVNENKIYFLIDDEIVYISKERVTLNDSTPKFSSYGICTTTVSNLDGEVFANKNACDTYIASKSEKDYESRFENRINSLYSEYITNHNCANNGGTLLFGDSNIDFWANWEVQAGLTKYVNGYNVGIGGSTTRDWLYAYDKLIKPFNAERIVFLLGFNDVFVWGEDGSDTVARLNELLTKIHTDNPTAKIYCIYQLPCPSAHNGTSYTNAKYEELVALTKQLCESLNYVTGIDAFNLLKGRNELFRNDNIHLNDNGYLVFSDYLYDLIFKGDTFGVTKDNNIYRYKTSKGVELMSDEGTNPYITFFGDAPQYAFVNDTYTNKLYFEAEFNVSEVLNNDNWPKFGLLLNGSSEMLKLYVDMTPSMTSNTVGLVHQLSGANDDWANAINKTVSNMVFTGNDRVKLSIVKDNKNIYCYVNDVLVIGEENCVLDNLETVGAFSFNTKVKVSDYLLFSDDAANTYIDKAINDLNESLKRTVIYKDGETKLKEEDIKIGNKVTYQPEKEGYSFNGWYRDSGLTLPWNMNSDVIEDNITLFAKFTINTYEVNYYYGSQLIDSENVEYNNPITKTTYALDGYTFDGWYKESTLSNIWNITNDKITQATNLYAKMNINSYTVNYYDGETLLKSEPLEYNSSITYAPEKAGHVFSAWYKDSGLSEIWNLQNDHITGVTNLYAKFDVDKYQVKYYDGDNLIDNETLDYNSLITKTTYTKQGYRFDGWYKEASLVNIWNNEEDRVTDNTNLYAKTTLLDNISLTTTYFTKSGSSYSLTSDSNDESKVDDVMHLGEVLRGKYYRVNGTLDLDTDTNWTQSRIIISNDPSNEYFIALEKVGDNLYQIFTMSKDNEASWNDWREIEHYELNGNRHSIDFEIIVNENKIYFLIDDEIVYISKERVTLNDSTPKFSSYGICTTTVSNLDGEVFANKNACDTYIASKSEKDYESRFENRINSLYSEYITNHNCANNGGTLLFGDSNIDFWANWEVQAGLTKYVNGYNVGIGGSTTRDWLYAYDKLIKPFNAERIVFLLGFNDVFVWGEDGSDTVARLNELLTKIHTDNPTAKIYCIYQLPCPSAHNGTSYTNAKYEELVALTKQLCESLNYVTGIDAFNLLKGRNELFRNDNIHLNDNGYLVFSDYLYDLIFKGDTFGVTKDNNIYRYKTSKGVELMSDEGTNPYITFFGDAPQYAFVNDTYTNKLYFEAEFNVSEVLNNDNWPKFGLLLNGSSEMLKLYVDMTPSMTSNTVGLVHQLSGANDDWANAINKTVSNMVFTGNDRVKLSIVKDNKNIYCYVNDVLVIGEENCVLDNLETVGAFSFNTKVKVSDYLLFSDDAANTYIDKAINDLNESLKRTVIYKDGETKLKEEDIKIGNKVTYQPEKEGYSFNGWYRDSGLTLPWNMNSDVIEDNITLFAKFTINTYEVNYYYGSQLIDSENVEYNNPITKTTYALDGYTFDGWYKESTLSNIWNITNDKITQATNLYAKMNINSYTVNYYDGETLLKSEPLEYNSSITYAPEKAGHVFSAWYKDSGLSEIWNLQNDHITGVTNLYAKFDVDKYQVKYYDGDNLIDNETLDYNSLITKTTYTKQGYRFDGWYKEASLVNIWNNEEDRVTASISLFAKTTINSYTVTYYDGTTELFNEVVEYNGLITHADPTIPGYSFVSWYKDNGLTQIFDKTNDHITADTSLYAKFTNEGQFYGNVEEHIAVGANFVHDDGSDSAFVDMIGNDGENYYPVVYVKNVNANKYVFETEIEALNIYNNDQYPKFGIYLGGLSDSNYRFYVDVNNEIRSNIVGLYKESTNDYAYAKANAEMLFKNGNTVKLKVVRNVNDLYLYVDDKLAIYKEGILTNENNYLGVFTYNMGLELSNYSIKLNDNADSDIAIAIDDASALNASRTISQTISGQSVSYDVDYTDSNVIVNARGINLSNYNLDLYFTANGATELLDNNGYMLVSYANGINSVKSYNSNNKDFSNNSSLVLDVERSQELIKVTIPYSSLGINAKNVSEQFAFMPAIYNNSDSTYHLFTESNPFTSKFYAETWYQANLNGALAIDPEFELRANGLEDWTKPDFTASTVLYEAAVKETTWQHCIVAIVCGERHGANMFDLHIQHMNEDQKNEECLTKIMHATYKPVLALYYNSSDLAFQGEILKTACKAGASAIDLPGYYYGSEARTHSYVDTDREQWIQEGYAMSFADAAPSESTTLHENVASQNAYIKEIHDLGSKVLLSEHVYVVFDKQQAIDYVNFMLKAKDIDVCKVVGLGSNKEDTYNCVEATKYLATQVDNGEFPGKRFSYHLTPTGNDQSGWFTRIINPAFFKSYVAFCYGNLANTSLDSRQLDIDMGLDTYGFAQTYLQAYLQTSGHSFTDLSIEDTIHILNCYGVNHPQYIRYRDYYLNGMTVAGRGYAKTGQHDDYWTLAGSNYIFKAKATSTTNGYPVRGFAYDFDEKVRAGESISILADITTNLGTTAYTSSTRSTRAGLYLGNNDSLLAYVYNASTKKLELVYNNRKFVIGDADALSVIDGLVINDEVYDADIINGDIISMSLTLDDHDLTLGFKDSDATDITQVATIHLTDEQYALIGLSDGYIKGGTITETYVRSGAIDEDKKVSFNNVSYDETEYNSFFGDAGTNAQSGTDISHDDGSANRYVTIVGNGTNQTYVKDKFANKFVFETDIEATSLNNNEQWPKFGICLDGFGSRMKFYIDMNTNMTSDKVALWKDNTFGVKTTNNIAMNFTNGNTVKVKLVRDDTDYYCYINDQLVIYEYQNLVSEDCNVGIFTFNTGLTLTNYTYLEGVAANNAINEAKEDAAAIEATYEEVSVDNIIANAYKAYNYYLTNSDNGNAYSEVYKTNTAQNIYDGEWIDTTFQMGALDLYDYDNVAYADIYNYVNGLADARNGVLNGGVKTGYLDAIAYAQVFAKLHSYDQTYNLDNVKAQLDYAMTKIEGQYYDYSWIDEDYMVGWVNTYLSFILNDSKYSDADYNSYMHYRANFYDTDTNLWFRDANYIYGIGSKGSTNDGKKVLWSRGNAWVYVGLARHLEFMEANGLTNTTVYNQYKADFIAMSNALVDAQRKDGFWNVNLSDSKINTGKETTGTSGFLYGLSTGIKLGYLDDEKYMNAATKAYLGLSNCALTNEGKLVYCQPIGQDPFTYTSSQFQNNTTAFGVGLYISGCKAFAEIYAAPYVLQGSGTLDDPYLVTSVEDYEYIADRVSSGKDNYESKYIKLTTDLGNKLAPITKAIGTYDNTFAGNLDGNSHSIYLDLSNDRGLINKTGNNTAIKNLTIEGSVNFLSGSDKYVGGLVGVLSSGSTIDNCINKATINSGGVAAGIVGYVYGSTITNCINYGNVKGVTVYSTSTTAGNGAGGIVGTIDHQFASTIDSCSNFGDVTSTNQAGGIVGKARNSSSIITNCANGSSTIKPTITVTDSSSNNGVAGGIVGMSGVSVTNCTNYGQINGTSQIGGIVGALINDVDVNACHNYGAVNASKNQVGGIVGWSYTAVKANRIKNSIQHGNIVTKATTTYPTGLVSSPNYIGYITGRQGTSGATVVSGDSACTYESGE